MSEPEPPALLFKHLQWLPMSPSTGIGKPQPTGQIRLPSFFFFFKFYWNTTSSIRYILFMAAFKLQQQS